jgi:hypothetical protein
MAKGQNRRLTDAEVAERRQLRLEAMNLQEIEGNPLDAEDIAMFEMFERERWNEEECLAYVLSKAKELASKRR